MTGPVALPRRTRRPPLRAFAAVVLAVLGSGCAVLQVDVDVYKGPLAHEEDVQIRQFASLAVAAKPVLVDLRDELEELHAIRNGGVPRNQAQANELLGKARHGFYRADLAKDELASSLARFVNRSLAAFENLDSGDANCANKRWPQPIACLDPSRSPLGIDALTRGFYEAATKATDERHAAATRGAVAPAARLQMAGAQDKLGDALIGFAERLLFVANNLTDAALKEELGADALKRTQIGTRISILQTLGNSLVLHANDLRRRRNLQLAQTGLGAVEAQAMQSAAAPGADAAFDAWMRLAKDRAEAAGQRRAQDGLMAVSFEARRTAAEAEATQAEARKTRGTAAAQASATAAQNWASLLRSAFGSAEIDAATGVQPDAATRGQELADRTRLREAAARERTLQAADLRAWFERELGKLATAADGNRSGRKERLAGARAAVQSHGDALALTRVDAQAKAVDVFDGSVTSMLAMLQDLQRLAVRDESERRLAVADAARLQTELQALTEAKRKADQRLLDSGAEMVDAGQAQAGLAAARKAVLSAAIDKAVRDRPSVRQLTLDQLAAEPAGESGEAKASRTAALGFVKSLTPMNPGDPASALALSSTGPGQPTGADDPRRSFDVLLAQLRQQRIQATAEGNTERANRLAAAMELAYQSRSATLFLRPASEYLKNVYSSTALADAAEDNESNMLDDWLKVAGSAVRKWFKDSIVDGRREAREQVEKLYWQSVNRVAVRGGGDTNYTLIKDDVGNWVVKAYAAKPDAVFRSAQSLALFATGARIDNNLLRRVELQRTASSEEAGAALRGEARSELAALEPQIQRGLSRVRDQVADNYLVDLAAAATVMKSVLAGLAQQRRETLAAMEGANAEAIGIAIAKPAEVHLAAASGRLGLALELPPLNIGRRQALADALLAGVEDLRAFEVAVAARLRADDKVAGTPEQRKAVIEASRNGAAARVERQAEALQAALDKLDAGITLVGQSQAAR